MDSKGDILIHLRGEEWLEINNIENTTPDQRSVMNDSQDYLAEYQQYTFSYKTGVIRILANVHKSAVCEMENETKAYPWLEWKILKV